MTYHIINRVLGFIADETGMELPDTSYRMVEEFLLQRLGDLKLNIDEYLHYMQDNRDEYDRFISEVTVSETYLFREEKHFDILNEVIFPQFLSRGISHPLFWSATCSTGAEALSLAALAGEFWEKSPGGGYTVYATDINAYALESFRKGVLKNSFFRRDGRKFHHLLGGCLRHSGSHCIVDEFMRKNIVIIRKNLFRDSLEEIPAGIDLVFFRNTMIYMPQDARMHVLGRIIDKIAPGGYLFLSSSEVPLVSHPWLKLQVTGDQFFFQRKTEREMEEPMTVSAPLFHEIEEEVVISAQGAGAGEWPAEGGSAEKKRLDIRRVCYFANSKLANRLFHPEGDDDYLFALQCLEILFLINDHKIPEAGRVVQSMRDQWAPNELGLYLSGRLEMAEGDWANARKSLSGSIACNDSFWPARFYLARIALEENPPEAGPLIARCLGDIDRYINNRGNDYLFLLEGFNAAYFKEMCMKMTDRIEPGI